MNDFECTLDYWFKQLNLKVHTDASNLNSRTFQVFQNPYKRCPGMRL